MNNYEALEFATRVHRHQVRKYTGLPYITHLTEVAGLVASVAPAVHLNSMVQAAYLHDSMEDQGVTEEKLKLRFGPAVAHMVKALTNYVGPENRAYRKNKDLERLYQAHSIVQTIKYADLISNTRDIVKHDPKFAVVYLKEKDALLKAMTRGDPRLRGMAQAQLRQCYDSLKS